ncbi:MAG: LapA family protein [Giesbergeria sp.]
MNLRTLLLSLTVAAIAVLAVLNWDALATPVPMSLGVTTIEAPFGAVMLSLTTVLAVLFVAYVLWLQGSVLLETRRHGKEMQAQRELADKAEASRFTEMKVFLQKQSQETHSALMARIETLESRLLARANESDNTTAAYLGQVEHQLRVPARALE